MKEVYHKTNYSFLLFLFSLTKHMNFSLLFLFVSGERKVSGMDAWMKKWYNWSVAYKDRICFFRVCWQRSSGNLTILLGVGLIRSGCSGTHSSKLWTPPKIGMLQSLMATCFSVLTACMINFVQLKFSVFQSACCLSSFCCALLIRVWVHPLCIRWSGICR